MAYPTQKIFTIAALFLGLAFAGGCQKNYDKSATCGAVADCPRNGAVTDFQVPAVLSCCAGYCVAEAFGCSSGLRYLTTEGGVGDCVDLPMCVAPDMQSPAVPVDFSEPSNGDM